jgi:hypothetical protein
MIVPIEAGEITMAMTAAERVRAAPTGQARRKSGRCICRVMGFMQRQINHMTMANAAFGNDVVGKALDFGPASLMPPCTCSPRR